MQSGEFPEQQREVVEKVGTHSICNAIRKEGMLVLGDIICINPRAAEVWCKKKLSSAVFPKAFCCRSSKVC